MLRSKDTPDGCSPRMYQVPIQFCNLQIHNACFPEVIKRTCLWFYSIFSSLWHFQSSPALSQMRWVNILYEYLPDIFLFSEAKVPLFLERGRGGGGGKMSVRVKSCNGVTVISKVSNQRWKCIKFNPLFFAGHNWVFWFFSYWDSNASSSIISFSPAIIDYSGLSPIEIQMHQVDLLFLAGHNWLFWFFLLLTFKVCLCIYCYVFVSVMYLFVCMAVCH